MIGGLAHRHRSHSLGYIYTLECTRVFTVSVEKHNELVKRGNLIRTYSKIVEYIWQHQDNR